MNISLFIYSAVLFFVLSPGVLLRLPSKGNKYIVAAVHSLVFAIALFFVLYFSRRLFGKEGFTEGELCGTAIKEGDVSEDGTMVCIKRKWQKNEQKNDQKNEQKK